MTRAEHTDRKGTVLCYSGGLDSTVLLYDLLSNPEMCPVRCISVDYGQRHVRELQAVRNVFASLTDLRQLLARSFLGHTTLDLSRTRSLFVNSSQTDSSVDVPLGHYTEESMKKTVVPNRNMILLSFATAYALSTGMRNVGYAAHSGDHAIYKDCRPEFVAALNKAVELCDWDTVSLYAPYLHLSKTQLVERGIRLGVPFSLTYTCYNGREKHCGKCGSCTERREAFKLAGEVDPTEYEST